MIRGLFTAASGMKAEQNRLDVLSNNLANVDLTGYKRDTSVTKAFPDLLIRRLGENMLTLPIGSVDAAPVVGKLGTGVAYNEAFTVFRQGSLKETDNPFDFALENKGFFVIRKADGEEAYTRNGSFTLDRNGYLVTKDGDRVLGNKGPVRLKLNNFMIDKMGRIFENPLYAPDNPRSLLTQQANNWEQQKLNDQIKVVNFPQTRYLKKVGNSFWKETPNSGAPEIMGPDDRPGVLWKFLESSNVNPVIEMVKMIEVNRAYESNQKVISTQNGMLEKLVNQASRF